MVGKMSNICVVIGCHNRHSKKCRLKFIWLLRTRTVIVSG